MNYTLKKKANGGMRDAEARVSEHRARATHGTPCHSAIVSPPNDLKVNSVKLISWNGANKLQCKPAFTMSQPPRNSKRGKVTGCSEKSMRRLKRDLARVARGETAYTFALTYGEKYPDAFESKKQFQKLQKWVGKRFREYGMFWKREPQKRGATHYHILAFLGDDFEKARLIGRAVLKKWCSLTEIDDEEQNEKVRYFHLEREENFEEMRGQSFFSYLGKYLSKDSEAMPEGYELEGGGNWWGRFNKSSIPYVEETELDLANYSKTVQKKVVRFLYELRQRRAQKAHERNILKKACIHHDSLPSYMDMAKRGLAKLAWKEYHQKLSQKELRNAVVEICLRGFKSLRVRKLPRFGVVTVLGPPEEILAAIQRFLKQWEPTC